MALAAIDKNTPIFKPAFEYQESTLQLPFGEFSVFSDLKANRIRPLEAIVTLVLCYRSNWSTGLTWRTSSRELSGSDRSLASVRPGRAWESGSVDPAADCSERE